LRAGQSAGRWRGLCLLPRYQSDRRDDRHDVGHAQLRDRRRGAQPCEKHAAEPAAARRILMSTVNSALDSSLAGNAIDQVKRAVNISDAATMENNFISLMVAQIKNQDPTKPVDSTEFLNQYSAMSQVKSMENMSSLMQSNLVLTDNLQTLTAAGLVGQQVSVAVDSLDLSGQAVKGQFELNHASTRTALVLTDSNGTQTRIELGGQSAGKVPFVVDPAKPRLAAGQDDDQLHPG